MATCLFVQKQTGGAGGPCASSPMERGVYAFVDGETGPVTVAIDVAAVDDLLGIVFGFATDEDPGDDLDGDDGDDEDMPDAPDDDDTGDEEDDAPAASLRGQLVESWFVTPEKLQAIGVPDDALPTGQWWIGVQLDEPAAAATVEPGDRVLCSIASAEASEAESEPPAPPPAEEDTMGVGSVIRKYTQAVIDKFAERERELHPELTRQQAMARVLDREPLAKRAYWEMQGAPADREILRKAQQPDAPIQAPQDATSEDAPGAESEALWKKIETLALRMVADSGGKMTKQQAIARICSGPDPAHQAIVQKYYRAL